MGRLKILCLTENTLSSKAWELGGMFMAAEKGHEHQSYPYCRLPEQCRFQKSIYNIPFTCQLLG